MDLYGEQLVDLCESSGIFIMNGRCDNDILHVRPTTNIGYVVDYRIGTLTLISLFTRFEVDEFKPTFSGVHCKVVLETKLTENISG